VSTIAGPSVLRLITIDSVPGSAVFDSRLRDEVLPTLLARAGVVDARIGRRFGPAHLDERVVALIWESQEAMESAIACDRVARLGLATDGRIEDLPLAIHLRFHRPANRARIMRIYRGQVRPGQLDLYVEDARKGATADGATSHGPLAFFLSSRPPDRFVSLSLWGDWSEIELSTGGNVRQPTATHHAERIVFGHAAHYEILPGADAGGSARASARVQGGAI
jgi:hypothetical protein